MLKRRFKPGDRVVVESPIYRIRPNQHARDAFNSPHLLGREGVVDSPVRDFAGDIRVAFDDETYTLALHPKGLLHVDDLDALALERAAFKLGDRVTVLPSAEWSSFGDVEAIAALPDLPGELPLTGVVVDPSTSRFPDAYDGHFAVVLDAATRAYTASNPLRVLPGGLELVVETPRFKVGDEVVIESPIFSSTIHGIYAYNSDLVGRRGNVRGFDEHDGDVLIDVGSFERDEWLVHPDGLLLLSELDELATDRAPRYAVGDRVEVVRSEYLWNGEVETHGLGDAPKPGDIVVVTGDAVVGTTELAAGNLTVADDVMADEGYLFDPAAVRPAPPVVDELAPKLADEPLLADWERELYALAAEEAAPARPKPGDRVELVDPDVAPWKYGDGRFGDVDITGHFRGEVVTVSADRPWHPDNVLVDFASGGGVQVLASALRVVPAPVEEAPSAAFAVVGSSCVCDLVVEEAPTPAPRTWTHRDDAGDLVKVTAESTYVEIELSGIYAVTRDEIEGDVATAELSPFAARQLAASIVAAADAVSPGPVPAWDLSIPSRWIVGAPAPTFGIPEVSLTERLAAYYR